ncbi:hypothetical protein [Streptomyces rimosus]|uniref:hypothetical protein n=1 Tax=Streptomyces rimosus TaxID=1927 RepID=UPI0004C8C107|nr:hypothetical protein [Streptomyces rimosus]
MKSSMLGTRSRKLATGLCTAAAAVALSLGAAGTADAQPNGYRVFGGNYPGYAQCVQAGSLSIALGLYSRYECEVIDGNSSASPYKLWYVD